MLKTGAVTVTQRAQDVGLELARMVDGLVESGFFESLDLDQNGDDPDELGPREDLQFMLPFRAVCGSGSRSA